MKRLALILMALVALGCALAAPAGASDVATAPDGTVTLVSGQQYLRVAPDGTRTPFQDYTLRETEEEGDPSVAVAPDGTATVAWVRIGPVGSAVLVRRIGPDGELEGGVTELVSHSEDSHLNPDVAVAPDGTATVVWTATFGGETFIQSSRIAPDGTAGKRVDLAAGGSYSPDVEVAPDGTATVVWHQFGDDSSTAAARQIKPDGSLDDALQLSSGACNSQDPALAVTPSGAAVVVWECIYPHGVGVDPDEILEERRIAPNGVPDKGVNTISAEEDAGAPVVAAGPDGTVTIVWRQSAGPMLERRIEPDGTPEDTIYDVSSPARGIYPKLAIADDGSATLVWSTGWQIFSRRLDPDGAPAGPLREVLSSNGYMNMLGMGFDPEDGSALPIWSRRLGYYETESALEASRLAADGTAGPIFYLTDPGTEPATWADPGSLAFGDVKIGTTVTSQVEFTNRSVDSTPVSGVYLQGADADQFQIVDAGSCTSQPIPFVSTCSVTVAFT
ncbi:MAG: hypothetical protein M3335_04330, partial [Actinomycetota bacterium]|nr:hypothetical protein [Actinomycetota bacterium]